MIHVFVFLPVQKENWKAMRLWRLNFLGEISETKLVLMYSLKEKYLCKLWEIFVFLYEMKTTNEINLISQLILVDCIEIRDT